MGDFSHFVLVSYGRSLVFVKGFNDSAEAVKVYGLLFSGKCKDVGITITNDSEMVEQARVFAAEKESVNPLVV